MSATKPKVISKRGRVYARLKAEITRQREVMLGDLAKDLGIRLGGHVALPQDRAGSEQQNVEKRLQTEVGADGVARRERSAGK